MRASRFSTITINGLQALLDALRDRGRRVVGPTRRDDVIVYDEIEGVDELPRGLTDIQDAGAYRLVSREDAALFGYAVGPHSWKSYLHPPKLQLWRAERNGGEVRIEAAAEAGEPFAFVGVRACELHAIAIQDKVLLGGAYVDPHYRSSREGALFVAVNCSKAGGSCFCASMGTGPKASGAFDLALTEIVSQTDHVFLVETGTEAGREILADIPHRDATEAEVEAAEAVVQRTAADMGREMPAVDVRDLLMRNLQHPRWAEVAERCLSCANCTMVCPTCFCTSVEEASDLAGLESSRSRRWDSCFTMDYSYLHGGGVRTSVSSRYRQWMTHKLATWFDQFGSSGCVGCGRCITWCPVGIDITEEVRAISESEKQEGARHGDA